MIIDVEMPHQGLTLTEAMLLRWLKAPGDAIAKDEGLFEIETEKAVQEVASPVDGTVHELLAMEGEWVPLGAIVARIATEAIDQLAQEAPLEPVAPLATVPDDAPEYREAPVTVATPAAFGLPVASPRAKRAAQQQHIDLTAVTATGAGGAHIVERDVLDHVAQQATGIPEAMSRIRQSTAERTAMSFREAPHFYLTREVVVDRLLEFREALLEDIGDSAPVRVSLTDCLVKALALALADHPILNRQWHDKQIIAQISTDISLAIDTPQGLLVPVLRGVASASLIDIALQRQELVQRARDGQLTSREMSGGSLTLSNLGTLGIDQFQPIINPPQSAILGVGAVKQRPVAMDGTLSVANTLFVTLAVDHRVADGADAARFLQMVVDILSHPLRLCCAPSRRG